MYTCECDAINPVLCVGLQRQICVPRYALRKGKASCPMVPRASPARVSLTTHENEPIYCSAVYLLCMCVVYIYICVYIWYKARLNMVSLTLDSVCISNTSPGKTIFHFMGTSTFSEYTVVAEISVAKVGM